APPVDDTCYPRPGSCTGEEDYCEDNDTPCRIGWEGTPNECAKKDNTTCQCCKPTVTVSGTQYVVDSELGDDSNGGKGTDDAFQTIQRCVEELKLSEPVLNAELDQEDTMRLLK
ncbi:unnamed protein product, partial [Meganyctiphanes norvegica]